MGFLLVSNACVLLFLRRWKPLRNYLLDMIVVTVCFAPFVPVILNEVSEVRTALSAETSAYSIVPGLKAVYWNIVEYILPGRQNILIVLRNWFFRIGILVFCYLLIKNYRRITMPGCIAIMIIAGSLSISFIGASLLLGNNFISIRHTAILFVPSVLALFAINKIINKTNLLIVCASLMLSFYSLALANEVAISAKNGDWSRVAIFIMNNEGEKEPIIVFRNQFVWPFALHYSGRNQIVPIPLSPNSDRFLSYIQSQILYDINQIIETISKAAGPSGRVWLITASTEAKYGIDFRPELLEEFVDKYCFVLSEKNFYRSKVRLLKMHRGNIS